MARPISFDPEVALERAMDLFWTRGAHRTSVEDIVQSTGLNRHSLYARYGNKQGLLQATIDHYCSMVNARVRQVLDGDGPVVDRLDQLLKLRQPGPDDRTWHDIMVRGCYAIRMASELREGVRDAETDPLEAVLETLEEAVCALVREGQMRGELRTDMEAEELATIVMAGFMLPQLKADARHRLAGFLKVLRPPHMADALQGTPG